MGQTRQVDANKLHIWWTYKFSKTRWDMYYRLWLVVSFSLISKMLVQSRTNFNLPELSIENKTDIQVAWNTLSAFEKR